MKKVIYIFMFLSAVISKPFAQTAPPHFHVTTIDSFTITNGSYYSGVTGLDAVEDEGTIHLSYLYTKNAEPSVLKYAITSGSVFFSEDIVTLDVPYTGYSAIQLDENKNPWVYLSLNFKIFCYKRTAKGWTGTKIDSVGVVPGITCIKNNYSNLGIFYWYIYLPEWKWELRHTYWGGNSWNYEAVDEGFSNSGGVISPIVYNNNIYVAATYVIPPDSTYSSVFARNGKGWNREFTNWVGNGYGNIGDQALLGISNDSKLHLWQKSCSSLSNYFIKEGTEWQKYPTALSGMGSFFKSENLYFSAENYTFSISSHAGFSPTVNWRSNQGEYSSNMIPYHEYPYGVGLLDFVITPDNYGHIFLVSGGAWAPYGDASDFMTFKELTFNASEVLTDIDDALAPPMEFKLYQNYPNPFNPSTSIKYQIPEITNVSLKVFDIMGKEIKTLVNQPQKPGNYEVIFEAGEFASGTYFFQIRAGNSIKTIKGILIK